MVAILVLLTIIVFLTVDYAVQRAALRRAAMAAAAAPGEAPPVVRVPVDIAALPAGVFVGPGHTWLELRPSGGVRLGVDRVPVTLLGGLDAVDTPPAGTRLRRGDTAAVLRKGERSLAVPSPLDGVVTGVNADLAARPAGLGESPFGRGWLVSLEPQALAASLRRLFVAEEATAWMRRELSRLRDFLVGLGEGGALAPATLPDGGLPVAGLAARLSDEQWRRLAEGFFTVPEAEAESW
jgi:glycine cleavage system H protein